MIRLGWALLIIPALALAYEFNFVVGNPVASQDFHFKTAAFVFRTEGCGEAQKPKISATAEGMSHNERRSLPLKVVSGSKPDIYAVFQSWPNEGDWLVNLEGTCGSSNASALVPVGPNGFIRESAKFFAHAATADEVNRLLKAIARGGAR